MAEDTLESAIQINKDSVVLRLNQALFDELYSLLSQHSLEAKDFFEKFRTTINECLTASVPYRVRLFEKVDIDNFSAEETQPTQEGQGAYQGFVLNLEEFMSDPKKIPLEGRLLFETDGKMFGIAFPFGSTTITATKGAEFVITQGSLFQPAQGYSQILIAPVK